MNHDTIRIVFLEFHFAQIKTVLMLSYYKIIHTESFQCLESYFNQFRFCINLLLLLLLVCLQFFQLSIYRYLLHNICEKVYLIFYTAQLHLVEIYT